MKISVLTLFPKMFLGPLDQSIIKRAVEKGIVSIEYVDIRSFGIGKHKTIDDKPYGGGAGMLYRVDVMKKALDSARCSPRSRLDSAKRVAGEAGKKECNEHVILLDPKGKQFKQAVAQKLKTYDHLILICLHYEGVDGRFLQYVDEEISVGDFVLTGGELAAMIVIDATLRLVPGVLGKEESSQNESFQNHTEGMLLEHPQYTRPEEYEGTKVPNVLLSGDHKKIQEWKKQQSIKETLEKRPELLSSKRE